LNTLVCGVCLPVSRLCSIRRVRSGRLCCGSFLVGSAGCGYSLLGTSIDGINTFGSLFCGIRGFLN
jgi:hypothetical protein